MEWNLICAALAEADPKQTHNAFSDELGRASYGLK